MDSDDHLDFACAMQVVQTWTQTCTAAYHSFDTCTAAYHSFDNFKQFMSSVGLQDEADATIQPDGFCMWKFRVVDARRWTLACIRYGF